MARLLDEEMLRVLRRMQGGKWMMAREIGGDSTQYGWLLRHGYITRRDAELYGSRTRRRWEYRITDAGLALLSDGKGG